jgi:hypothetical protein
VEAIVLVLVLLSATVAVSLAEVFSLDWLDPHELTTKTESAKKITVNLNLFMICGFDFEKWRAAGEYTRGKGHSIYYIF